MREWNLGGKGLDMLASEAKGEERFMLGSLSGSMSMELRAHNAIPSKTQAFRNVGGAIGTSFVPDAC